MGAGGEVKKRGYEEERKKKKESEEDKVKKTKWRRQRKWKKYCDRKKEKKRKGNRKKLMKSSKNVERCNLLKKEKKEEGMKRVKKREKVWKLSSTDKQGSSLDSFPTSPPLYPHFNRPSGFWPCVKSCLVGGSDKYLTSSLRGKLQQIKENPKRSKRKKC